MDDDAKDREDFLLFSRVLRLLAHVELYVIGTEVSSVNGVICFAEMEVDGDLKAFFGDDLLEFVEGSFTGHPVLNGNGTVIKNVDEFFPDLRS